MTYPIDFVITWVDGQDEAWRQERAHYSETAGSDNSEARFRDWGLFKYWFRGVENFAPWIRTIHFVTWGHLPTWLNTSNPKLHIVKHEDYIPSEFLPTFNCNVLEIYLDRIKGLSDHFVYFNDDIFLIQKTRPEHFFKNGQPCDMLSFQPVEAYPDSPILSYMNLNNVLILSKYFNKRKNVIEHPKNYFHLGYPLFRFLYNLLELKTPRYTSLYTIHNAYPFHRDTFREVWEKEEKALMSMSKNRFRSPSDLTLYLFREWQKLSGNFHAENVKRGFSYFSIDEENGELLKAIRKQKSRVICLNDVSSLTGIERIRGEIQAAFQEILPEPSSFEL